MGGYDRPLGRSIPASAGEPVKGPSSRAYTTVYPASAGNRDQFDPRQTSVGSIPASAGEPTPAPTEPVSLSVYPRECGEPSAKHLFHLSGPVYPRECGGTGAEITQPYRLLGLSPRVRGNQAKCPPCPAKERSIPASAGEPSQHGPRHTVKSVYPRECGGTEATLSLFQPSLGLSPRVRGTHNSHHNPVPGCGLSRECGGTP